jgi:membrane protein DedA with SNARE-associated domain
MPNDEDQRRRGWLWSLAALAALLIVLVAMVELEPVASIELEEAEGPWPYVAVFVLIFGDAVLAVLPGETTLNTASTLAAQGVLELGWVMVAGAAGAVLGDSALYWLAQLARSRVQSGLDTLLAHQKVARTMDLIGSSAGALLVFGRYVPGGRFVVNASLGLARHPYRDFVRWSAVGGVRWSIYICSVAYVVGTALVESPLAAVAVSAVASSVVVAIGFVVLARGIRRRRSVG